MTRRSPSAPTPIAARARSAARAACFGAVVLAAASCADPALLDLHVVVPEGPDPLAGVERLRLRINSPRTEHEITLDSNASFSIESVIDVADGALSSIVLEGLIGADIVARGETPPLSLGAFDDRFNVLVTRAGAVSTLTPRLTTAHRAFASAVLPSAGVLLAGGVDNAGAATRDATLYDFFLHALRQLPTLPDAREGALAADCGGHCALVVLGRDGSGKLAQKVLRFDGAAWSASDDGLSDTTRRADASMALLGDGRWLIVGGVDAAGSALATMLRLDAGNVDVAPRIEKLSASAHAARVAPSVASSGEHVLVVGGQQPGAPLCEVFDASLGRSEVIDLGVAAPLAGAAAAALADGRFIIAGGRMSDGTLTRDAWIIDARARSAKRAVDVLAEGRSGHHIARLGDHLVVIAGRRASGSTRDVEIIASDGLTLARSAQLARPRGDTVTLHAIAPGVVFIAGGDDGGSELEVYQSL